MADSAGGYERPVMKMAAARPLAAALLTLAFVACGAPSPVTGTDKAKPSRTASHPPSSLVASPEAVSQAVVAAWARNDRGTIEQLTTATARAEILKRPFPEPQPTFVNCQAAPRVAGAELCLFQVARQQFTFTVEERGKTGWLVTAARFET